LDQKNNKLKILIVNTLYYPYKVGGAEISVQTIAEGLHKIGIEVMVVTLGEVSEETVVNEIPLYRLRIENIFWPFDHLKRNKLKKFKWHFKDINNGNYAHSFNKIISFFKPDVIHTHNLTGFSVSIWEIAKRNNIKIVHTLRDYYLQCPRTCKFKNDQACTELCTECYVFSKNKKRASQQVDAVVGLSRSILKGHIDKGYFLSSLQTVIYNGFIIPKEFNVRKKFSKNSILKLGYIGRIDPSKGIDYLVETLSRFSTKNNWKLYIAGNTTPEYKKNLASLLPENKIEFLGYTNQEVFFEKVDVLIVPTLCEESFGRVVLEALLSNVVVLGSKKGGIPELLNANRKFIFDPLSTELIELFQKILENPEILNTFHFDEKWLKEKFSIQTMIHSHTELYSKVI